MPTEHEVVALTANRPQDGLRIGDVGAIIHCDRDVYEIDFIDEQGHSKRVATVPASQIMKLNLLSLSA